MLEGDERHSLTVTVEGAFDRSPHSEGVFAFPPLTFRTIRPNSTPSWHPKSMLSRALSALCLPLFPPRHALTHGACPWTWSEQDHLRELSTGISLYPPASDSVRPISDAPGCDLDCGRTHSVGIGNAGPDERVLGGGHLIHATADSVLTPSECAAIVDEARAAMESGVTASFKNTAASNHHGT